MLTAWLAQGEGLAEGEAAVVAQDSVLEFGTIRATSLPLGFNLPDALDGTQASVDGSVPAVSQLIQHGCRLRSGLLKEASSRDAEQTCAQQAEPRCHGSEPVGVCIGRPQASRCLWRAVGLAVR